jgi:hypothetical protein
MADLLRLLETEQWGRTNINNEAANWFRMLAEHQTLAYASLVGSQQPRVGSSRRCRDQAPSRFSSLNLPSSLNPQVSYAQRRPVQSINDMCRHFAAPLVQSSRGGGHRAVSNAAILPRFVEQGPQSTNDMSRCAVNVQQTSLASRAEMDARPAASTVLPVCGQNNLLMAEQQQGFVLEDESTARHDISTQEEFERAFIADDSAALLGVLRAKVATQQLVCLMTTGAEAGSSFRVQQLPFIARAVSPSSDWSGRPPLTARLGLEPQAPRGSSAAISRETYQSTAKGATFSSVRRVSSGATFRKKSTTWPGESVTSSVSGSERLNDSCLETVKIVRFAMPVLSTPATPRVYPGSRPAEKSRYLFTGR